MLVFNPETQPIQIQYQDASGTVTRRVVFPVSWVSPTKMLAYCFTRRDFRHFLLDRIQAITPATLGPGDLFAVESAIEQANLRYPDPEPLCI